MAAPRSIPRPEAWLAAPFGGPAGALCGSGVGQEPWHAGSDVDLAVEGLVPAQCFPAPGRPLVEGMTETLTDLQSQLRACFDPCKHQDAMVREKCACIFSVPGPAAQQTT